MFHTSARSDLSTRRFALEPLEGRILLSAAPVDSATLEATDEALLAQPAPALSESDTTSGSDAAGTSEPSPESIDWMGLTEGDSAPPMVERPEPLTFDMAALYAAEPTSAPSEYTLRVDETSLTLLDTSSGGELAKQSLSDVSEISIAGADEIDDVLTIDVESGAFDLKVSFHGGVGGSDRLLLNGEGFETANFYLDDSDSGEIAIGSFNLNYAGLESITDTTTVGDRVFTVRSLQVDNTIRVGDDGESENGLSTITSDQTAGFASVAFLTPTDSLTVKAGDGNDTMIVEAMDDRFVAPILLEGKGGDDSLIVYPSASKSIRGGLQFNGGAGGVDSLRLVASPEAEVEYLPEDDSSGLISFKDSAGESVISFTELEPALEADPAYHIFPAVQMASGPVLEIESGVTLAGSGTVAYPLVLNGRLSPGNSPGCPAPQGIGVISR